VVKTPEKGSACLKVRTTIVRLHLGHPVFVRTEAQKKACHSQGDDAQILLSIIRIYGIASSKLYHNLVVMNDISEQ
jgi:hypothetical protein